MFAVRHYMEKRDRLKQMTYNECGPHGGTGRAVRLQEIVGVIGVIGVTRMSFGNVTFSPL